MTVISLKIIQPTRPASTVVSYHGGAADGGGGWGDGLWIIVIPVRLSVVDKAVRIRSVFERAFFVEPQCPLLVNGILPSKGHWYFQSLFTLKLQLKS